MRAVTRALGVLILSVVYVAVLRIPTLSTYAVDAISNVGQLAASGLAAAGCTVAARRHRDRHRSAWAWLAAGMGSWCMGQAVWTWYELMGRSVPYPSLADVGFLGLPMAAGFGLLLWLGAQGNQLVARSRDVMAGAIIASSLLVLSWITVLGAVVRDGAGAGMFALVLSLAYPVGDLIMATLVLIALTRGAAGERPTLLLFAAGLTMFAVADSAFVYLASTSSFSSLDLISNGGWFGGFLLMGLAGMMARPDHTATEAAVEASLTPPSPRRVALTYLPLLVAASVVVGGLLRRGTPQVDLLLGVALVGMVLTHQLLAMTENQRLLSALADARDDLRHQSLHDPLTGLPNRRLFARRLDRSLVRADADVTLLLCELDGFRDVNDLHGHRAGDAILRLVADRLTRCVRDTDTVARTGGDEFAILLEDAADPVAVGEAVSTAMRQQMLVEGRPVHTSVRVGLARRRSSTPGHGTTTGTPRARTTDPVERDAAAALLLREAGAALELASALPRTPASSATGDYRGAHDADGRLLPP